MNKKQLYNKRITQKLEHLEKIKLLFDPKNLSTKTKILQQLQTFDILTHKNLINYHDLLCFLRAYPENKKIYDIAEKELKTFAGRVDLYKVETRDKNGEKLANSGIVNTETTYPYSYDLTLQLHEWHAKNIELDYEINEDAILGGLFNSLPMLVSWQENDTLDNEEPFDAQKWLNKATGENKQSLLHTLLNFFSKSELPIAVQRYFFEELELSVSWNLENSKASRTLKRLPGWKVFYQKEPIVRRSHNLREVLKKPKTSLKKLSKKEGNKYVQSINEVLATRNRELLPLSTANPSEVYINNPGRGLTIVIYGQKPELRLPLESNFGAMFIRNGIPIGYGVAATLFDRVEIAMNIFPAFRSGESAYAIEQFFRIFYHHFGSRVFLIRSTQMGDGEDEALYSGAFWFYYKLGFRAVKQQIRKLSDKEHEKIKSLKKYRVPIKTMKRLAKTDVFFHTDKKESETWQELSLVNLGYAVTDYFAKFHKGDRKLGSIKAIDKVVKLLNIKKISDWSEDELTSLKRLSPMIIKLPEIKRWPRADKSMLADIVRAKGSMNERRYVRLCNSHKKFRASIDRLAKE